MMQQTQAEYNVFGISHQKGIQNDMKFHTHFQYEIFIFYNGDCKYAIGDNMYELEPGDIVIMDGSLMHRPFIFSDPRFYERSIVQFSRDWISPVLKSLNAGNLLEKFEKDHFAILRSEDVSQLNELEKHVQAIEEGVRDSEIDFAKVEIEMKLELVYLLLNLEKLFNTVDSRKSEELGEKYEFVQEAVKFVQNNFQEGFTLDEVAEELNISKSYLVHLFKELTGNTVMDYAMSYRLKQSMHMLVAYPDSTNKEICYRCGFKNESHFSRYFKSNVGMTPRQFKRKHIN